MAGLRHGTWWDRTKGLTLEDLMEGRFTRLFDPSEVPPAKFDDDAIAELADAMTSTEEDTPTPEDQTPPDPEENPAIVAGYTYLGQFIDHDITFDPTSQLRESLTRDQLRQLVNFRTPRLDLDNVYGRGPDDQPYMYKEDSLHMELGDPMSGNPFDAGARQLPRGPNERALIGDPRNDENRIVAQLHCAMLRFHNRMVDVMAPTDFQSVRQQVRWHYQWMVVTDFLKTVIQADTYNSVFPDPYHPQFKMARLEHGIELMPVEFSVAAYRFGHSMIRPQYRLNTTIERRPIFSRGDDVAADLGGFRAIPSDWAIDWQFFVDLEHGGPANPIDQLDDPVVRKPQHAYKPDTSLVFPLAQLPAAVASNPSILALRNLERGQIFELPSGQDVARALDVTPIPDERLIIGKATGDPNDPQTPIASIRDGAFAGKCPLWTYVLAEAYQTSWDLAPTTQDKATIPIQLGPVGGRIIAEVLAALLIGDPTSYLNASTPFTPREEFVHHSDGGSVFGLAELLNAALGRQP
jgi:hypothetical protein